MTTPAKRRLRLSRDTVLFVSGLIGIAYETLVEHGDRPTLLILFAGMVGLPAFLRGDELRGGKPEQPPVPPVPPTPPVPQVEPTPEKP